MAIRLFYRDRLHQFNQQAVPLLKLPCACAAFTSNLPSDGEFTMSLRGKQHAMIQWSSAFAGMNGFPNAGQPEAAVAAQQDDAASGQLPPADQPPRQVVLINDNVYPLPPRLNVAVTVGKLLGEGAFGKVFLCVTQYLISHALLLPNEPFPNRYDDMYVSRVPQI